MIKDYLNAAYPALYILTQEPHRAEKKIPCEGWQFFSWDCIRGITEPKSEKIIEDIRDPVTAMKWLEVRNNAVLMMHNLHLFLDIPEVVQMIQNSISPLKSKGSALVSVSPVIIVRPEIEKFFHVIELPLPGEEELYGLQLEIGKEHNIKPNRKAARSAKGLTEFETETAYAYSLIRKGYFSSRIISEAKGQMIKKSGLMEFWEPADIQDVGGLRRLKSFIEIRQTAFSPENEHLPRLKGILLVGIPGTGKSLSGVLQFE